MSNTPRVLITPGEPAGIGPDLAVQIAQEKWPAELVVIADPELLCARAKQLDLPPLNLVTCDLQKPAEPHQPGTLKIIPVALQTPCVTGQLNRDNAAYVMRCLELATDACLNKQAQALVTGPIQKSIMNEAGLPFSGHTEFLAERCGVSQALMLFVVNKMKVALVTTHLPLADVPKAITPEKLMATVRLLDHELQKKFGIMQPRILVCGLNPHAGENGHLGREEIEIITPALNQLRDKNINVIGPLPADTIFTEKNIKDADAILAMYHDQALPVVKYAGFSNAVNVTLGLPIIRTSVDHGTALDIAGTKKADPDSLKAAIKLAIDLIRTNELK